MKHGSPTPYGHAQASPEAARQDPVVAINVELLHGPGFGEVLQNESIGGNAGSIELDGKRLPCAGINGYADHHSGLISTFGNVQNVDPAIVARDSHFILRVAVDIKQLPAAGLDLTTPIVDLYGADDMDPEGKARLQAAIAAYNADLGVPIG